MVGRALECTESCQNESHACSKRSKLSIDTYTEGIAPNALQQLLILRDSDPGICAQDLASFLFFIFLPVIRALMLVDSL